MQSYFFDIDSIPINIAVYEKREDDFILAGLNKQAEKTENRSREELVGKRLTELFPGTNEFSFYDVMTRVEKTGKSSVFETNYYDSDRICGWRHNEVVKLSDGLIGVFYKEHSLEKALQKQGVIPEETSEKLDFSLSTDKMHSNQENYLKIIVNAIPDLIWLKNRDGKYLACNAEFERFYGIKESDIIGKDDFDFVDFESASIFQSNDRKVLETEKSFIDEEILTFADDGYTGLFEIIKTPMKDKNGKIVGILGIGHDISERKEKEEQLSIYANYDMLTGLANRTLFMNRLSHLMSLRKTGKQYSAVLFIDLDHFKEINDTFGHATGDRILKLVAKSLQSVIRKEDTLSRHGGDEFTILLENINKPLDAAHIAQNILDILRKPLVIENHQFHITTSIGITIAPDDSKDPETLLRFADIAMYKAKDSGRNMYTFYTHELSKQALERVQVEHDLRQAITNREFSLYYQPQINVLNKKVVGAEVLLRWNHPSKGMIMPLNFIHIAESSGQIIDIGKWVIWQAMENMSRWKHDNLDIDMISINLSARQLHDASFIETVRASLEETGCKAEWIEFEVTEGYAMSDYKAASSLLKELHDLGCNISIDDFGTGYSSLAHLKRLPIQKIKIDQSFVQDVPGNPNDEAIVSAVILIAKSMNLDIIAEGVETTPQQEFLLKHGCVFSQGFLYTEPIPKEEFETYLKLISEYGEKQ